jgi:hypothetical protein
MDNEWVGRAGILAEGVSFFLIAPEVFGPERLKGAEEALRKGLGSLAVQRTAVLAWAILFVVVYLAEVTPLVIFLPGLGWPNLLLFPTACLSLLSGHVCRNVVRRRLMEQKTEGAVLFARQGQLGRVSMAVLNPVVFGRIMKPSCRQWIFWGVGIPFHFLWVVGYIILPTGLLTLIHLEQRLLARGVGLRSLVFITGVAMLFGGMVAQFVATF